MFQKFVFLLVVSQFQTFSFLETSILKLRRALKKQTIALFTL